MTHQDKEQIADLYAQLKKTARLIKKNPKQLLFSTEEKLHELIEAIAAIGELNQHIQQHFVEQNYTDGHLLKQVYNGVVKRGWSAYELSQLLEKHVSGENTLIFRPIKHDLALEVGTELKRITDGIFRKTIFADTILVDHETATLSLKSDPTKQVIFWRSNKPTRQFEVFDAIHRAKTLDTASLAEQIEVSKKQAKDAVRLANRRFAKVFDGDLIVKTDAGGRRNTYKITPNYTFR